MARVDAGALSIGASGTIAQTLTFSRWKGRPYVRQRVIPSNPRSGGQVGMRSFMRWGSRVWSGLSTANKATWESLADASAISPFNAFISRGQVNARNNLGYQREYPAESSSPPGAPTTPAATAVTRGLSLSWTDPGTGSLFGVIIYRSTTTGFTPAPSNVVQVVDAGVEEWIDTPLDPDTYYYVLKGFDFAGVLGTATSEFSGTVT